MGKNKELSAAAEAEASANRANQPEGLTGANAPTPEWIFQGHASQQGFPAPDQDQPVKKDPTLYKEEPEKGENPGHEERKDV